MLHYMAPHLLVLDSGTLFGSGLAIVSLGTLGFAVWFLGILCVRQNRLARRMQHNYSKPAPPLMSDSVRWMLAENEARGQDSSHLVGSYLKDEE